MGCVDTITAYRFPKQSEYVNRRCKVCFHYDTTKWIMGTVIRDDREEPFETLIHLDDGRTIRGCECQYSLNYGAVNTDDTKEQDRKPKEGHWIFMKDCSNQGTYCSECMIKVSENPVRKKVSNFCPGCGAKMNGMEVR